jgi:hypothetical protein
MPGPAGFSRQSNVMRDDSEKSAAVIRAQIGEAPLDVGLAVGASLAATEARTPGSDA